MPSVLHHLFKPRKPCHSAAMTSDGPFILIDDARPGTTKPARLYTKARDVIVAHAPDAVTPALVQLRAALRRGQHVAGFMSYEAGYALEPKLAPHLLPPREAAAPLLWFGVFDRYEALAPADVSGLLPPPHAAWAGAPQPRITPEAYKAMIAQAQDLITAGDIYQANLTFGCDVPVAGHPLALYAGLRRRAAAGYSALVFTGATWLLSLSPELFFTLEQGRLTTRPMKGTVARPRSGPATAQAAHDLAHDPKQRAENLMIVDLLRNDLARVAQAGSVRVPALFDVEHYPTVLQMTSTITAQLAPEHDAVDVLATLFPCGSVTGAPKIRAMEIIAALEAEPRGVYTGTIGYLDPNGDAAFNVAIRTLQIDVGANRARMGLGSGVVADSHATSEWQECLDKGAFVATPPSFDLIETMRFDPDGGITLLDGHMARMKASAAAFGIPFNHHDVRNMLQGATIRHAKPCRLRLLLSPSGATTLTLSALPPMPEGPVACAIVPQSVDTSDIRLRHKTSSRAFYDDARGAAGAFEVVFTDPQGFLTEGSFTNIFVPRDGVLLTPPATRGLLPGVFRAALIARGAAVEADLTPDDLREGFFIGNALRGLLAARVKAV